MTSTSSKHFGGKFFLVWANCMVAAAVFTAMPGAWAQSNTANQPTQATCIAIMAPTVEGVPGSAVDAGKGVSDLIASYLQGPSMKTVVLEAKLSSLAAGEAKQKGCESLLVTSVRRKSSSHGFMKALAHGAGSASWGIPYGGTSAASTVARTGSTAGLQTLSSMADSTKAKDELSLEYRLQSPDGKVQLGPKIVHRAAKADGEDLLTPVVAEMAQAIVSQKLELPARGQ